MPGIPGESPMDVGAAVEKALSQLRMLDSAGAFERARDIREQMTLDRAVIISSPQGWGEPQRMATVHPGDTIAVVGVALDTAGVASVALDGRVVAEAKPPKPALDFRATVLVSGSAPQRNVPLVVRTADGREIRRVYTLLQVP